MKWSSFLSDFKSSEKRAFLARLVRKYGLKDKIQSAKEGSTRKTPDDWIYPGIARRIAVFNYFILSAQKGLKKGFELNHKIIR